MNGWLRDDAWKACSRSDLFGLDDFDWSTIDQNVFERSRRVKSSCGKNAGDSGVVVDDVTGDEFSVAFDGSLECRRVIDAEFEEEAASWVKVFGGMLDEIG